MECVDRAVPVAEPNDLTAHISTNRIFDISSLHLSGQNSN